MWITAILVFLLILADQLTKYFAMFLGETGSIEVGGIARFVCEINPGAAFGLGSGYIWILVVISGLATLVLAYLCMKNDWKHGKFGAIGTCMALAGCVGNLIDRFLAMIHLREGVIDMIQFTPWNWFLGLFGQGINTFNVADVLLVFGLIFVVIDYLFFYDKRARKYGYYSKRK